jgi:hypothetical protein
MEIEPTRIAGGPGVKPSGNKFDCFVGIDWSGDKQTWQKGIKVAIAAPGSGFPVLEEGPGPNGRWSRSEIARWIGELVHARRALIGLDFAFGFPAIPRLMEDVVLDWDYVERFCESDSNFYGGRFFRAAGSRHAAFINSPWLPKRDYSAHHLRETEKVAKQTKGATPQSVFNAYGAAQVGPSSISGMRMLLHLRQQHASRLSIWPFDDLRSDGSAIVEIFPRYFALSKGLSPKLADHAILNAALRAYGSDAVPTPPKTEDEGDALLSAAALRSLSERQTWFGNAHPAYRTEGWIFGVPIP